MAPLMTIMPIEITKEWGEHRNKYQFWPLCSTFITPHYLILGPLCIRKTVQLMVKIHPRAIGSQIPASRPGCLLAVLKSHFNWRYTAGVLRNALQNSIHEKSLLFQLFCSFLSIKALVGPRGRFFVQTNLG